MAKLNTTRERPAWLPDSKPFGRMYRGNNALYNSARWRRFSEAYKRNNPLCSVEGCNNPTAYTDHIQPISVGGAVWDMDNIQPLCISCNASK
ncbi:MAG: HNH endonuclease, partial [Lewinellaceae bacterium]|nr:HNH endonuclease [Lewinellaceae bacterium]